MRQYAPLQGSDESDESDEQPVPELELAVADDELSALLDPGNPELQHDDRLAILEALAVRNETTHPSPLLRDGRLVNMCSDVLDADQLDCLARTFGIVACPGNIALAAAAVLPAAGISLCEFRGLLRIIGCEASAAEVLVELHELERWLQGDIVRRPALSMLHGLELHPVLPAALPRTDHPPEAERELASKEGFITAHREVSVSLDDFVRLMSRGKLRRYLPGRSFFRALQTVRLLSCMFGSLAEGPLGDRTLDRSGLALACTLAGAQLSEFEMQQLWGILANADGTSAGAAEEQGGTRGHSGWLVRDGGREGGRSRRCWCTLEPSRGRLLFLKSEGGRATDDYIEMAQCSSVYATTAHARARDGDDGGAAPPAAAAASQRAIGLVTVSPAAGAGTAGTQRRHVFFCEPEQELQRWLEMLQGCQRFHANHDRASITWGQFLLGMGQLKATPLGARFDCFASHHSALQSADGSAVDEQRARELMAGLGLVERVGECALPVDIPSIPSICP